MIKILFFLLLSQISYANDEKTKKHFDKLVTCSPDTYIITPDYIAKRSSITYKQTIKGFKGDHCLVEVNLWVFNQQCLIPKDKLIHFKNYSPKNQKQKETYNSIFQSNCKFPQDSLKDAATNGVVSSLIAPLVVSAKKCDEGNKASCQEYKNKLLALNTDCTKGKPSDAVCKKFKTAGFK